MKKRMTTTMSPARIIKGNGIRPLFGIAFSAALNGRGER
jgi:hypothetical protein